ncbi:MAG: hypothetical protein ACPGEF_04695, partial [Endozoicomonas sp.]
GSAIQKNSRRIRSTNQGRCVNGHRTTFRLPFDEGPFLFKPTAGLFSLTGEAGAFLFVLG